MTPAASSKFRGVVQFTALPMAYRVGRAGLGPFKQRQYSDKPPWALSHALSRALDFHEMLFRAKILREVPVGAHMAQTLLVASDAQADTSPTGGFIALVDGEVSGSFCYFKPVLGTWGYQMLPRG